LGDASGVLLITATVPAGAGLVRETDEAMGSGRASDWEIVLWLVATIANSAANRMVVFNLATGNIIGILHSLTCDTGCQGI
jgi:hypothetical protein